MTIEVELPDGSIAEFPDDMPQEKIQQTLQAHFAKTSPTEVSYRDIGPKKTPGYEQRAVSEVKGFGKGLADPFVGLTQLVTNVDPLQNLKTKLFSGLEESSGIPLTTQGLNKAIKSGEKQYQEDRGSQELDVPRLLGNILSPLNIATGAIGGSAQGSLFQNLMRNMGTGSLMGAMSPVTEGEDYATEKGGQIGLGGLAAGVTTLPSYFMGRVVAPHVPADIQHLREMGVTPTIGQRLGGNFNRAEQGFTSAPLLGGGIKEARNRAIDQWNVGIGNQVLEPLGERLPANTRSGRDLVEQVGSRISNRYDSLLPRLTGDMDPQFRQEMAQIQNMGLLFPDQQRDQLDRILQTQVFDKFTPQGRASGDTLKEVESQLGRLANGYMRNPDFDQRNLGRALRESQRVLRSMVERTNPQYAGELQPINQAWANFLRMENAAGRTGAVEGTFNPAQLRAAARSLDPTRRKSQFARGTARMQGDAELAQRILGTHVNDSGTPFRTALGLGMLGGGYMVHPGVLAGELASMLPYTRMGQSAVDTALSGGMGWRRPIGEVINRLGPLSAPLLLKDSLD